MSRPDGVVGSGYDVVAHTLAARGYNPSEHATLEAISEPDARRKYLQRSLETTVNHVFQDSAVSFTNHYAIGPEGQVLTYPDGMPLSIDPDERGGLYTKGIAAAVTTALHNPSKVVLLYSPPGPVVFDNNPSNKFRFMAPYTQGQLYVMYADHEKVHNTAISTSPEGESWIEELMPTEFQAAPPPQNEIERVSHFITQPALLSHSIDELLSREFVDRPVFTNKDGQCFTVSDILPQLRLSITQQLPTQPIVAQVLEQIDFSHISEDDIHDIYRNLTRLFMVEYGVESMKLGGGCGGTSITLTELLSYGTGNFSASTRSLVQRLGSPFFTGSTSVIRFEYKPGHSCRVCGADGGSSQLGDCDICASCQERFDTGELQ